MRRLAERAMVSSRCSGGISSPGWLPTSSMAICDATSPALAPPMPSATTKKGGSSSSESSFEVRWRPTSLLPTCSTILRAMASASFLVAVLAVADADHIRDVQPLGRVHLPPIQIGAVCRPHVLDIHEVPAGEYSRVGGRSEGILHENVRAVAPAHGRAGRHVERRAGLMTERGHHFQPRLGGAAAVRGRRLPAAGTG